MKCEATDRPCLAPQRCEIIGCVRRLGEAEPAPPAAQPEKLGWLERKAVALHDKLEGLGRRKPLPSLSPGAVITLAPPPTPEPVMSEEPKALPAPEAAERRLDASTPAHLQQSPFAAAQNQTATWTPPAPPPPAPLKPARRPRDIRVVTVPAGGYACIEDNALVAVAMTEPEIGAALAGLLRAG